MLTPSQQALDLIQKSKNILIALPESLNGDSLGSALALEAALKKLNKKVEVAAAEAPPDKLSFLAGAANLKNKLTSLRDFVISIDTSQNKISRLRYETANSVLKIFLATPQKIEQRDIKLEPGPFYYDLIITIDAPDLESLGQIFSDNTELFFNKSKYSLPALWSIFKIYFLKKKLVLLLKIFSRDLKLGASFIII